MDEMAARTPDWAMIREEYEGRLFLPEVICRRHGITPAQLRYRREMEGWLSIRARPPRQDELVARMLKVLDKHIRQLEAAVDEPIDKRAKMLSQGVSALDKLIKLGAAKPNAEPPSRKDEADLRARPVKRMKQFEARGR